MKRQIVLNHVFFEFLLLNLSLITVFGLIPLYLSPSKFNEGDIDFFPLFLIVNLSWALVVSLNSNPQVYLSTDFPKRLKVFILNSFILVGITFSISNLLNIRYINPGALLSAILLFSILDISLFRWLSRLFRFGRRQQRNTPAIVVSAFTGKDQLEELAEKLKGYGYGHIGLVDNSQHQCQLNGIDIIGNVNDLSNILEEESIEEIFINLSSLSDDEVRKAIEAADFHGVRVNLVNKTPALIEHKDQAVGVKEDFSIYQLRQSPLDKLPNFLLKKIFDFAFATFVLLLLSPIFILIALLIKLTSKGPVFFTPYRVGERGRKFKCYKFRTMTECDDPVYGTKSTVQNDPRITSIGKYLRKYDLDELPQFINVLRGEMSVIGPRPHRVFLQNDFRKVVSFYLVRHYVKPGISGWAQVNGWRGPTSTAEQKKERIKHDLWYIENWSFWLDLKIIFLTVFGKSTRKNAF